MTPRRYRVLYGLIELSVVLVLLWVLPAVAGAGTARFGLPLDPPTTVVRGFDPPEKRWLPGHRGVDLSAVPGAAVRSAGEGTVTFAGQVAGRPVVSIRHADGIITTYEPVRAAVESGRRVRRGEMIGTVVAGHPGCRAAACLHWGARRGRGHDATYLNPLGLVGGVRVRLKPLDSTPVRADPLTPADGPDGAPHAGVPR